MNVDSTIRETDQKEEKNRVEAGVLYLIATPIGNLGDLSPRAVKILSGVDFVAAEDTRNSGKLLTLFGIKKPMISYFEHNKRQRGDVLLSRLQHGESCALITDAGTPAISDPGEDVVRLCAENGIRVTAVPGCCAAIDALSLSALATGRFAFEGFLSGTKSEKKRRLDVLSREPRTLIFYEAPHRLAETLDAMREAFGDDRKIALCRELTKLNEEIFRTTLAGAVTRYADESPRGEYVLVVEGTDEYTGGAGIDDPTENPYLSLSPAEHVARYEETGLRRMDAIKAAARDRGISKSELYKMLLPENSADAVTDPE